jgi:hypothetical protein
MTSEKMMNHQLQYPRWQVPLEDAILEFDPPLLRAKLQKAEKAVSERRRELDSDREACNRDEQEALADALTLIRILWRRTGWLSHDQILASNRSLHDPAPTWS